MLPSPYTSRDSLDDAAECARLLGCRLDTIGIDPAMQAFDAMLAPLFAGRNRDTTEENIQSRIRGVTLMALSNKFGPMLLTTGNKSEMSVGYATIYGDMAGGYSVLKDVYKTTVFKISEWRNANRPRLALGPDGPVMPAPRHRQAAVGRAARQPDRPGHRCRPTTCSIASCSALSSTNAPPPTSPPKASTPPPSPASNAC